MEHRELTWHERGRLWLRLGIRITLTAVTLLFLFLAGPTLLSAFMPFILALAMAWLLDPLVRRVQKRAGVSRKVLSFLLVVLIFSVAGGLLFALVCSTAGELIALANNWQAVWSGVQGTAELLAEMFSGLLGLLPIDITENAGGLLERLSMSIQDALSGLLSLIAARAGNWAMGIPPFAVALIVFIMGAYFILADYPHLRFQAAERLSPEVRGLFSMIKTAAGAAFGGYIRSQLVLSSGVFVILLLGLFIIRQPYALLLAFLLAILDFIPIIGSGTVIVPWAAVSAVTGEAKTAVSLMVIWGVVALFRRVGEPKILGTQTGLSPILTLVSIYAGMRLAGVVGMVFGPIICLIFLNLVRGGIFGASLDDLRLAVRDISALLKNRPKG